jgi:hypothetical protein
MERTKSVCAIQGEKRAQPSSRCEEPLACGIGDWRCPFCQAVEEREVRDIKAEERARSEKRQTVAFVEQLALAAQHHPDKLGHVILELSKEDLTAIIRGSVESREVRRGRKP